MTAGRSGSFGTSVGPRSCLRCEVDGAEAVELGNLDEHALGRAIRIGLDGHRAHALAEIELPGDLFLLQVDTVKMLVRVEPMIANLLSGVT